MKKTKVSTMNFSLPQSLRKELDQKVQRLGAYSSTSEYLRELVRRDLQRDAIAQVDALLTEGEASGPLERVDERWWKDRYTELERHRRARVKKQRKRA
jgi:antitoxin ParD1/3/4